MSAGAIKLLRGRSDSLRNIAAVSFIALVVTTHAGRLGWEWVESLRLANPT